MNNTDLDTAIFMKDIYLSSFIGTRKTTVYAILEKLKSRYGVSDKKSVISNLLKDKELTPFSAAKKYLYDSLIDGQKPFLDVDYTARFVAAIFTDASEFIELASERNSYEERIFDDICLGVFNRISNYNSGLVTLKCRCGKTFIANPDLISTGNIGCPYCNSHVGVRNAIEYESARSKSILNMMPKVSNRKIDSIKGEILTIVDTANAKVYEVEAFKYLQNKELENEAINLPTLSNLNEYRKLDEIYIRPIGIREGVPICDSLRFYLGLTTSVGSNSVALFNLDYINDRHFFYKEGIKANVFTLRGYVSEEDWLLKAFLATLHFYSYTTSWSTSTALELACKVKLLGITPEVLKNNDINLFESDCREAENLLRRV